MAPAFAKVAACGAAAVAAALGSVRPVHAEGKKPIYDDGSGEQQQRRVPGGRGAEPVRLTAALRAAREAAADALGEAQRGGQRLVDGWIRAERSVERVVRSTVPETERLMPGALYVGVAALAGPIFTRRRNVLVRWASPFAFGAAAAAWFLPGTASVVARNVWGRYGDPAAIDRACDSARALWDVQTRARDQLAQKIQDLRLSLQEGRAVSVAPAIQEPPKAQQVQEPPKQEPAVPAASKPAAEKPAERLPLGFTSDARK
ncbi:hypothetical protein H4R18_004944 [Coemansia javaensis]|uniref:MICOS complex subunit n=1 Tax=Coemansia javaensis TaxID=2761396 RepID=A0A9W8H6F5_9FUNG|nr:hypothetical protein H4R18_004944 [Coemansia javaensis]